MLPPFISDLVQQDTTAVLAYTTTEGYHKIIDSIVDELDDLFMHRVTNLTAHSPTEDAVQVDMEHILKKFFMPFYENLQTIQGKDEFSGIVAADILAGLLNRGYNAQKVTRYDIGADNLYSTILVKKSTT